MQCGAFVCVDIKLFSYEKLNLLTEQLLIIMAKKRHEQQVSRVLCVCFLLELSSWHERRGVLYVWSPGWIREGRGPAVDHGRMRSIEGWIKEG